MLTPAIPRFQRPTCSYKISEYCIHGPGDEVAILCSETIISLNKLRSLATLMGFQTVDRPQHGSRATQSYLNLLLSRNTEVMKNLLCGKVGHKY